MNQEVRPPTTDALAQNYDEEAARYDRVRFEKPSGQFVARLDAAIVAELVRRAGARFVLDLPVGTGRALDYIDDQPVRVVGCDLTEGMLKVARDRGPSVRAGLVRSDASRLPFADASFDAVLSLRFFHLFPREVRHVFVGEFRRVLRPGGHLICSFTNGWYAGGVNWARKAAGANTVHFLAPGELRRLFPGWRVRALRGNFLPLQRVLAGLGPRAEAVARWFNARPPLNAVCWERYYLLESPGGSGGR